MRRAGLWALGATFLGAAPLAAHLARAQGVVASLERHPAHTEDRLPEVPPPSPAPLAPALVDDSSSCPQGMVLVEGDYCPKVVQRCLRWLDPPGRYHEYRCAEYARPARCAAPRRHERYCIDRRERAEPSGLPLNRQSWTDAARACEAAGARVCLDSEWTFACEGEEMRPYPYGWERDSGACNAARHAYDYAKFGTRRHCGSHCSGTTVIDRFFRTDRQHRIRKFARTW